MHFAGCMVYLAMARGFQIAVRFTEAELNALDALVKRELRSGQPADRSSIVRALIMRARKGNEKWK